MTAKHTPPGDASFRVSLLRNLGGGVALIVLVAVAFLGVGQLSGTGGGPEVAGAAGSDEETAGDDEAQDRARPEPPEEVDPPAEPAEDDEEAEDDDGEAGEPEADEEEPGGPEDPEPEAEPTEDDEEARDEQPEAQGAGPTVDPGDITVQVLDGIGTDGRSAADRVAAELGDGGYRVIAQNPAVSYDVTTVLWTSGNEDRARQVAAAIGAPAVRQQPGNLSERVDVHVVVGADRR